MTTLTNIKYIQEKLYEFDGSNAKVWKYHVNLKRFALKLYFDNFQSDVAYLISISTDYFSGRTMWKNAKLEVYQNIDSPELESIIRIVDTESSFELISSGGIVLIFGKETNIDKEFDSFLSLEVKR